MVFWFLLTGVIIAFIIWQKNKIPSKIKDRFEDNNITKRLNKLPKNCIVLHDVYIPKKNGSLTRINHIVINHNGLFVIDTKNYNGLIMGTENSEYWTQVVGGQKDYFYNPILQNDNRIKVLQHYLRGALEDVPVHSVIVFGKHTILKLDKPIKKAKVIKRLKLSWVLHQESKKSFVYYNDRQFIKELLSSSELEKSVGHEKKQFHRITDINQYRSRKKKSSM